MSRLSFALRGTALAIAACLVTAPVLAEPRIVINPKPLTNMVENLVDTIAPQGNCARGERLHAIDWMAYAGADADPAGVPRRVEGRARGVALGGDTIGLRYGGLTRRLSFDSPRMHPAANLPYGLMRVEYDLLQYEEFVEVHLNLPRPVSGLTLVFADLNTANTADSSVRDAVWVEAFDAQGRMLAPGYFYPTMDSQSSASRVVDMADRYGFGAPWAFGTPRLGLTGMTEEPLGVSFTQPVVSATIRFTGLPAESGGWSTGASTNPPLQRVDIISGAYCG